MNAPNGEPPGEPVGLENGFAGGSDVLPRTPRLSGLPRTPPGLSERTRELPAPFPPLPLGPYAIPGIGRGSNPKLANAAPPNRRSAAMFVVLQRATESTSPPRINELEVHLQSNSDWACYANGQLIKMKQFGCALWLEPNVIVEESSADTLPCRKRSTLYGKLTNSS